jgi:hypothetical protein
MTKLPLTLLAAGVMAVAGLARADAIFYPDGRVVELGESGAESLALSGSDSLDTSVLGAGPSCTEASCPTDTSVLGAGPSTKTTTVSTTQYVYVQPNINFDRATAMTQLRSNAHLMHRGRLGMDRTAAATFDSPTRAGEASTMTGGAPNVATNNQDRIVVGSYMIPHSAVTAEPYYVFSY